MSIGGGAKEEGEAFRYQNLGFFISFSPECFAPTPLPITDYPLPITHSPFPNPQSPLPITDYPLPITYDYESLS